jgi:DEAD/DEAH box helicase domain-containing protein
MSRHHLDAYAAVERARAELSSFLRATFRFLDPNLDERVHRRIDEFGLLAPCVAEATFPYEEPSEGPRTTQDLADKGLLHPQLVSILAAARGEAAWPANRPLYRHQVDAIRAYREGCSTVVASGTGSGKTECFLLPAIDSVLRETDEELERPGVRVLIVYPLNALVNNQMDRLRALIGHHPQIRFALYTRRLVENEKSAARSFKSSGAERFPAEVVSREELRKNPPHILVTNFSMLEYALVRPADASLFRDDFVKPRLVVLDEAHVYAGSMAAEITMLLRRAWLRWGLDPHGVQGIVTSATMHQGVQGGESLLQKFAADVLSKQEKEVRSIAGRRILGADEGTDVDAPLPEPAVIAGLDTSFPTLATEPVDGVSKTVFHDGAEARAAAAKVVRCLRPAIDPSDAAPARLLWEALAPLAWVRKLRRALHEERLTVDRVAKQLFGEARGVSEAVRRQAVHKLLEVLSFARPAPNDLPLMPVRLHAIMRGPHGVFACVNAACPDGAAVPGRLGAIFPDPVGRCGCGSIVCELRLCEGCGQSYLLADEGVSEEHGVPALEHVGPRKAKLLVPGSTWDDGSPLEAEQTKRVLANGQIVDDGDVVATFAVFPGGNLVGATRQLVGVGCPHCALRRPNAAVIRRIESGTDAALQVILEGLYPTLPEHANAGNEVLRARGRRALLFADNRQIAASLAAKVEESHDIVLSRAILVDALRSATARVATTPRADQLMSAIVNAKRAKNAAEEARLNAELDKELADTAASVSFRALACEVAAHPGLPEISTWREDLVNDLAKLLITRELARRPSRGGNLEASGIAIVDYVLSAPAPSDPDVARAFPGDVWSSLLGVLLDMLRTGGLVSLPALADVCKQLLVKERYGKTLVRSGTPSEDDDDDDDATASKSMPLVSVTATTRRKAWLEQVLRRVPVTPRVTPTLVLEDAWRALAVAAQVAGGSLSAKDEHLSLRMEDLRFRDGLTVARWRCPTCRTVWARQVANVCPTNHCNGTLEPFPVDARDERDRLSMSLRAREENPLLGIGTEEHTAQIGVERLAEVERDFKAGKVNVLVSSTTMELGIDIGGLSATMLTNVPPGPSNYLQRAGRAGRRAEGTSLVLTFARPRPFDQAVFEEPDKPFRDRIVPPAVTLDSRRIVQRHANAYLLAAFFHVHHAHAEAPDPMSSLRNVGEFFDRLLADVFPGAGEGGAAKFAKLGVDPQQHSLADAFVAWLSAPALTDPPMAERLAALLRGTCLNDCELSAVVKRASEQIVSIGENVRAQLLYLRDQRRDEERRTPRDEGALTALQLQEEDLVAEKLLGYLAEEQFLPRYGFPVQVVPLDDSYQAEPKTTRERRGYEEDGHELRLTRDVSLAINEYAPGAEVVAAKRIHTSRGLLRHWTGTDAPGVLAWRCIAICDNEGCGQLQYRRTEGEVTSPCPTCKQGTPRVVRVMFPKFGFAVKWGKPPQRWAAGRRTPLRPITEASYAARKGEVAVQVSAALAMAYDEEGQVLVRTEGDLAPTPTEVSAHGGGGRNGFGYAICYRCGRAEPETHGRPDRAAKGGAPLPKALQNHFRLRGSELCGAVDHYWRHVALAGAMRTETLRVELRGAAEPTSSNARRLGITWLVALQLAAGELLGMDSRRIGGLLEPRRGANGISYDAVLYDQVAGGAGYCRALLNRWQELLDTARRRLDCTNPRCTNGCHRCLIAYETQRYEKDLRRSALAGFLFDKWEALRTHPEREGVAVAPLFRGGTDVRERLARSAGARIIAIANAIGEGALDDDGWLRVLLRHADRGGQVDVVLAELPNPNLDDERFLAERLRVAMAYAKFRVRRGKPDEVAALRWRLTISDTERPCALYVEPVAGNEAANDISAEWMSGGVLQASDAATPALVARAEALVGVAKVVTVAELTPPPPPPTIVVHTVPEGLMGARAKFDHWLKSPTGRPLFERLTELTVIDPYLATEWQISLLGELIQLARDGGCTTFKVETYGPSFEKEGSGGGVHRTVTTAEQRARIGKMIGLEGWKPLPEPAVKGKRKHKRLLLGMRQDGTKFEVILERGIDFIEAPAKSWRDGRPERSTRETFLIVKDPP